MLRPRKLVAGAALAVAAVPLLAGCHTSPGAAALVGDHRISAGHLQDQVNAALANTQAQAQLGTDRAGFVRVLLAHDINVALVNAMAEDRHITVTRADIASVTNQFIQQAGSLSAFHQQAASGGVPASALPSFLHFTAAQQKIEQQLVANLPVTQQQLRAEYQKNIGSFDQVHAAHILVKTKTLAQQLLRQVQRSPSSFARLAKQYSTDTQSAANGGDLGQVARGSTVSAFDKAIFSHRPGSYFIVHSQFGWHVVHVISRHTVSLAQATPQLKQSLFASRATDLLTAAETAEAKRIGVHVSPRYGAWKPADLTVVAAPNPVSSPA